MEVGVWSSWGTIDEVRIERAPDEVLKLWPQISRSEPISRGAISSQRTQGVVARRLVEAIRLQECLDCDEQIQDI